MSEIHRRYLWPHIKADLKNKMVFLGGPRQVGKTTLSQSFLRGFVDDHPAYLNWDNFQHREIIRKQKWPRQESLIILDEIHKTKDWRSMVKGFYDTLKNTHSFLITGSAKLNHFRKGGDSLLGRYHYYRLHPYSVNELLSIEPKKSGLIDRLMQFGGFPESYHRAEVAFTARWHIQRLESLIQTDLNGWETVQDLEKLTRVAENLAERVGSPLSFNAIAKDFEIDFKTAKRWIQVLDSVYYSFQIPPFGFNKKNAVKKEQKLYLWDWSQISETGIRFENLVASHLLKYCHYHQDVFGKKLELRFLRDIEGREIDFVVLQDGKPLFAVECKSGERQLSKQISYFQKRLNIPNYYQVHLGTQEISVSDQISILPFAEFCKRIPLV